MVTTRTERTFDGVGASRIVYDVWTPELDGAPAKAWWSYPTGSANTPAATTTSPSGSVPPAW